MARGERVRRLQEQCEARIEHLVRKTTSLAKDPVCRALVSLSEDQQRVAEQVAAWVELLPPRVLTDIFNRVLSYTGEDAAERLMTPMDVWALLSPRCTQLIVPRPAHGLRAPLPNTHKAVLDCLHRLPYLHTLNIAGLDHTAVKSSHNDLTASEDVLEHYRYIITDALGGLPHLASLNLGSLATNNTLRVLSNSCPRLRELRLRAPAAVTDLGVRYLAGLNPSAAQQTAAGPGPGCLGLQVVELTELSLSLHTLSLLLLHLPRLTSLDHNHLHEALWLMDKTGMDSGVIDLQLRGYNGRSGAQCSPDHLGVLAKLCPRLEQLHLGLTWPESFLFLSRFRNISHLSVFRVASVENFDLPLMAFGSKLVKLELTNCTNFTSGTALNLRKYCAQLRYLRLEVDSADGDTGGGLEEVGEQNIHQLEHQVSSLQERLNTLQGTMLTVMGKYGDLCQLEELHLRNLGMGSLLILLPFAPHVRRLTLKYSLRAEEGAPNITDSLFLKIFERNPFLELERVEIWCRSLSIRTAEWMVRNCSQLVLLRSLSAWNTNEEEQVALWREGRRREPNPVEVDF